MFIVIEGIDGAGSTTQKELLVSNLATEGYLVVPTGEPTQGAIGKLAKDILQKRYESSPEALQLVFTADRADHVYKIIKPSLKEGKFVVSDRYFWSTIVFGGLNCDMHWLKTINDQFPEPDLIFYLKLDPKEAIRRIEMRGEGIELFEKEDTLTRVAKNYEALIEANKSANNIYVIDADKSIEGIGDEIFEIVKKHLASKK